MPADLRWIEVDFPDVLDYKYRLLANEKAHCKVERLSVDLNDPVQRQTMYDKAGSRALMITEGVLMYLPAATVKAMAAETHEKSGVVHWIADITTDSFNKALTGGQGRDHLGHVGLRTRFQESRFSMFCAPKPGSRRRCAAISGIRDSPRNAFGGCLVRGLQRRRRLRKETLPVCTGSSEGRSRE
jgi:O-methyltransferase involved in polyketide biosynthesis